MAAPWSTITKDVGVTDSWGTAPTRALSTAFVPPAVPSSLSVPPLPLFAAIARMQALRTTSPAIIAALLRAATALTEAVFDDATADLDLLSDVEMIEQTARTALAGSLGAGVCDLCMVAMGYTWHDHASRLVVTKRPLADFVYDGGAATGHGVVLAEAKGSFAKTVDATSVRRSCEAAYARQAGDYVGQSTAAGTIVHGYAIKAGCQLTSVRTPPPPYAFLHVTQTPPTAHGVPSANVGTASTAIALGNYRAAFMLAGASAVVQSIDALRGDRQRELVPQLFDVISTPRGQFLTGSSAAPRSWEYRDMQIPGHRFGIRLDVAASFLNELSRMLAGPAPVPKTLQLPVVPTPNGFENDYVFPDGFSLLPFTSPSGSRLWSAIGGMT